MKTINNLEFELFYSDNYCQTFYSLDKAIKMAGTTFKNNKEMLDSQDFYTIKLGYITIASVKAVNGNLIIE